MKIALIAPNDHAVTAEGGGNNEGLLVANRDAIAIWETFTITRHDDGTYSFQSNRDDGKWGRFVCAEDGGGRELTCNRALGDDPDDTIPVRLRTAVGVWEHHFVIGNLVDGGEISIQTWDGVHYWGLAGDILDATRTEPQLFQVRVLEGGIQPGPGPRGIVRTSGRMLLDDGGPKHFLSTTFMWSVYGYEHEHDRWLQNIQYAASKGCDGIRTLGSVMGNSWKPRVIDPTLPGYEAALAGQIDEAFAHGLRQFPFTMLGDHFTDVHAATDRMINVLRGREEKIGYIEICNEWGHATKISEDDLLRIARKVRAALPNTLLALSRPPSGQADKMKSMMRSIGGPLIMPRHTARGEADRGWRQARQPYDFADDEWTCSNQEPPGPASSVGELRKPRQLGAMRWLSHAAGCGVFVYHTGNGVRGTDDPANNRKPNLWEIDGGEEIWAALHEVTKFLPEGIQNWEIVNNGPSRRHPLSLPRALGDGFWEGNDDVEQGDCNKNYAALGPNGQFAVGLFGLNEGQERRSGQASLYPVTVTCYDSLTGTQTKGPLSVARNHWLTLPGRRDREMSYIIIGQRN